jgi:hypothetical protein
VNGASTNENIIPNLFKTNAMKNRIKKPHQKMGDTSTIKNNIKHIAQKLTKKTN